MTNQTTVDVVPQVCDADHVARATVMFVREARSLVMCGHHADKYRAVLTEQGWFELEETIPGSDDE